MRPSLRRWCPHLVQQAPLQRQLCLVFSGGVKRQPAHVKRASHHRQQILLPPLRRTAITQLVTSRCAGIGAIVLATMNGARLLTTTSLVQIGGETSAPNWRKTANSIIARDAIQFYLTTVPVRQYSRRPTFHWGSCRASSNRQSNRRQA
jgi:hypothetical protein